LSVVSPDRRCESDGPRVSPVASARLDRIGEKQNQSTLRARESDLSKSINQSSIRVSETPRRVNGLLQRHSACREIPPDDCGLTPTLENVCRHTRFRCPRVIQLRCSPARRIVVARGNVCIVQLDEGACWTQPIGARRLRATLLGKVASNDALGTGMGIGGLALVGPFGLQWHEFK
jgi:hypothetical protein